MKLIDPKGRMRKTFLREVYFINICNLNKPPSTCKAVVLHKGHDFITIAGINKVMMHYYI
jgi:hypothetical protein